MDCRKTKTKVITLANQQTQTVQWTNQNSKQINVTGAKRGKTTINDSRLDLVLLPIGQEMALVLSIDQSQKAVKQTRN